MVNDVSQETEAGIWFGFYSIFRAHRLHKKLERIPISIQAGLNPVPSQYTVGCVEKKRISWPDARLAMRNQPPGTRHHRDPRRRRSPSLSRQWAGKTFRKKANKPRKKHTHTLAQNQILAAAGQHFISKRHITSTGIIIIINIIKRSRRNRFRHGGEPSTVAMVLAPSATPRSPRGCAVKLNHPVTSDLVVPKR